MLKWWRGSSMWSSSHGRLTLRAIRRRLPPLEDAADPGQCTHRIGVVLVWAAQLHREGGDVRQRPQKPVGGQGFRVERDAGPFEVGPDQGPTAIVEHPHVALRPGPSDGV